jgi:hypothetical protein
MIARGHTAYELMQLAARFYSRVEKAPEPHGCWLYTGGTNDDGYGIFHVDGQKVYAHRFSFIIHHGKRLPKRVLVCHRCDIRRCIREEHLFLGTAAKNARDRELKRSILKLRLKVVPLRRHPNTAEEREARARLIHEFADLHYPQRFIARLFNVHLSSVQRILARDIPAAA